MGILDRFRNSQPPTQPRGASGRTNLSGFIELEELNADLRGRAGLRIFDKMYRTDPDVRRNVWMVCNPVIGGTWTVEPHGGDHAQDIDRKAAELVEWALFEAMSPGWKGHLAQALPVGIRSGFAPFEEVWQTTEFNGKTVLVPKTLGLRLPRTVYRWIQDGEQLTAIYQMIPQKGVVEIPADDLLYYRFGAEGDNWEGISLLRAAYKPWLLKDKLERIDAIKAERQAVGVPICYPPHAATDDQLEQMEEILSGMRAAEQAYVIAPGPHPQYLPPELAATGWYIDILGKDQAAPRMGSDLKASMEYHSDKIAAAFLAEFMRLGQGTGAVGARATADVQQNPFLAAIEALASEIEAVVNENLVSRITALNFNVDEPPKLTMSLVDSTSLEDLADYVQKLSQAGALHDDEALEDFLRDRADLPPADPVARQARQQAAKQALQQPPAPQPGQPTAAPTAQPPEPPAVGAPASGSPTGEGSSSGGGSSTLDQKRSDREMRWWEKLMELDTIEASINGARDRFQAAAGDDSRRLARELSTAALAGKSVTPKADRQLQDAIYGELARLYRTGQQTVRDELDAQRRGTTSMTTASDRVPKSLLGRAKLAAQSIASRIWQKANQATIAQPGNQAAAQGAAEQEAAAALRAEAQIHAAGALNAGRQQEALAHADEIVGARYTSILDQHRCEPCGMADDDVLRPLDDPVYLAHQPPNPDCAGGGRCRCMEFYELTSESPGSGGPPPPDPEPLLAPPAPGADANAYLDVSGGSPALRSLVDNQLAAIDAVHRMPETLPKIPMRIRAMGKNEYGSWSAQFDPANDAWVDESISLNQTALSADPPITSAVHEVGHFLDAHGFGSGPPRAAIMAHAMTSSTDAMVEWRQAVGQSAAYKALVKEGNDYGSNTSELLARSYEQWIAQRSGNEILLAKIAARRQDNPNLYWSGTDFAPIAAALDRFFTARGLLR